jgi:hypothetical protein
MVNDSNRYFGSDLEAEGWYAPSPAEEPAQKGPYEVDGSVIYFDPNEEESWVLWDASCSLDPDTLGGLGLGGELQADLSAWHHRCVTHPG